MTLAARLTDMRDHVGHPGWRVPFDNFKQGGLVHVVTLPHRRLLNRGWVAQQYHQQQGADNREAEDHETVPIARDENELVAAMRETVGINRSDPARSADDSAVPRSFFAMTLSSDATGATPIFD